MSSHIWYMNVWHVPSTSKAKSNSLENFYCSEFVHNYFFIISLELVTDNTTKISINMNLNVQVPSLMKLKLVSSDLWYQIKYATEHMPC